MNRLPALLATAIPVFFSSFVSDSPVSNDKTRSGKLFPKIQAAILLDVSNSMDGLIDQAKNQLWNMVNVLSKVTCDGNNPAIEIALYEYGRENNNAAEGFVKQITPFTKDLDRLFSELVKLKTYGGEEFCGHVMYSSLTELNWDTLTSSYKVIFISGNESFLQGNISFTKACAEAKRKGVIINTIYCGSKEQGIRENWNLGAECGKGSFSHIDQNATEEYIPTPYDTTIITLKGKLNETYIIYGLMGSEKYNSMMRADTIAVYNLQDPNKVAQWTIVKANGRFNSNADWDLVEALEEDPKLIDSIDMKTLVDSLHYKDRKELKKIVENTATKRKSIQQQIAELSVKQEKYIKEEKEKQTNLQPWNPK